MQGIPLQDSEQPVAAGDQKPASGKSKGDVGVKRWIVAWGRYRTVKRPKKAKQMIDEEVMS